MFNLGKEHGWVSKERFVKLTYGFIAKGDKLPSVTWGLTLCDQRTSQESLPWKVYYEVLPTNHCEEGI
jgi:hypothetical protein